LSHPNRRISTFNFRHLNFDGGIVFGGRFSSTTGVLGIDFGARGAKLLQVREHNGALHVVGAARVDSRRGDSLHSGVGGGGSAGGSSGGSAGGGGDPNFVDSEALAGQLQAAFASGGFAGRRCVVSLPRSSVCIQSIRLPKMPDHELRQSAVWEASQRFGFDRNSMEVDFIRTGAALQSGETREEVIIVAASHAAINARLEPVIAAGLRPIALDTGFAALVRTFSRQFRREADQAHVRAIVEVGFSGSTVLIVRGDQIAFCKPINIGGEQFNQAVAEHLRMDARAAEDLRAARIIASTQVSGVRNQVSGTSMSDTCHLKPDSLSDPATDRAVYEAVRPLMGDLIKEVSLCLRYYGVTFRGHPPEKIILTGGDGLEPRLNEMLAQSSKTPVVYDDESATLASLIGQIQTSLNRQPGPAACWGAAIGLSLRGVTPRRKGQKSEIRGQKAETRSQMSDVRGQPSGDKALTSDLRPLTSGTRGVAA
jgi:type IV pilus assembly protein PilM